MPDKVSSVRVDGFEITRIFLMEGSHETQEKRDKEKSKLAVKYGIPRHYIKFVVVNYRYCKITGKNVPINIDSPDEIV